MKGLSVDVLTMLFFISLMHLQKTTMEDAMNLSLFKTDNIESDD